MSHHEYIASKAIAAQGYPFYALIMAAMRAADSENLAKLQNGWPQVWVELDMCYNSPDGEARDRTGGWCDFCGQHETPQQIIARHYR